MNGHAHGFLRETDGTSATFDVPGSIDTHPQAINPAGKITGSYSDGFPHFAGFVRSPQETKHQ